LIHFYKRCLRIKNGNSLELKLDYSCHKMSLVGYNADSRSQLTLWDRSAAGALSGALVRLVGQPLDVAKIRLQLQVESDAGRKYSGLFNLLFTMPKEEGIRSLWKGHLAAQLLSISYGVTSFGVFELLTKLIFISGSSKMQEPAFRPVTHFVCGGIGGCAATIVSFPFDVIRTRMVAQSEVKKVYTSSLDAVYKLQAEGGIKAFYRGLAVTMAAVGPQTGLQFGFYSLFNQIMSGLVTQHDSELNQRVMTTLGSLSCGALAGLSAKLSVYPLDTVKKRLQISGWEGRKDLGLTVRYAGAMHCLGDIFKREGVRGLYKGVSPALIKSGGSTSLHFWLYEHICYVLTLRFSKTDR